MSKRRRTRHTSTTPRAMRAGAPARRPAPAAAVSPRTLILAIAAVAAVVLVGFAFFASPAQGGYTCQSRLALGSAGPDGVVTPDEGGTHVPVGSTIKYAQCPPSSGEHYAAQGSGPIPPRFYSPESEQSPGGWVHNLEHGYVVILYSCGGDGKACPTADELQALERFQDSAPSTPGAQACGIPAKVLTVRFDSMDARFAFVAWDRVALSNTFDAAAAATFVTKFTNQSPEPGNC